jgi:phosphomannomutase
MLADVIAATVVGHGRDCLDLGVAATPSVGAYVRTAKAAGAIQISASHNPPPYNGMKLFSDRGRVLPRQPGNLVLEAYRSSAKNWVAADALGKRQAIADPHAAHLELVLATVNVDAIRRAGFRVLLDSNHGAGAILGARLLQALGCEVVILGEKSDGLFEHPPEPLADNLAGVAPQIVTGHFDIGFCQDPDADRLALIDEKGAYIGEEYTAVLCTQRRLMQTPGPVVTNCASSNMTQLLAQRFGVPFQRSKVGEANVVDMMLEQQAVYGGEGSGGPIDPRVGFIRDSFVGMAQVLDFMAATKRTLSQLVQDLPKLYMIKDKVQSAGSDLAASIDRLATRMHADSISDQDGIRLDWSDAWLLLRGSNTEPIVRIIAESSSEQHSRSLIDQAKQIMLDRPMA